MKKFLVRGIKSGVRASGEIRASERVEALSLPAFDLPAESWGPASLYYSLVGLAKGLLQGLC